MINPCGSCKQGEMLTATSSRLENLVAIINDQTSMNWDKTMTLSGLAKQITAPDSDFSLAKRAEIEQKQEYVLDTTSRTTRIAGEMTDLITGTLQGAEEVECDAVVATQEMRICPKLLRIVGIHDEVQALSNEMPKLQ